MKRGMVLMAAAMLSQAAEAAPLKDWPRIDSAIKKDAAIEKRAAEIVAGMTLAQKVGQMTQAEIQSITPAEVRSYYVGSVLNGGGSWPHKNKYASVSDWVTLADRYYSASMSTDMKIPVPVIWGIDAVHGNNNVFGATIFPHNIGLGAAHDAELVRKLGAAVGKSVRATGINWVFAPTVAVVQDVRWGRTYESFSQDPQQVKAYAAAYVAGLQGKFDNDDNVVATAKHFLGDGGTDGGKDQGETRASLSEMINVHGQGYYGALGAGAQTVMASFSSWNDTAAGIDHGKMHGNKALLTGALKGKMGFDGFVVSDWNGHGQVPGCKNDSCAAAINAGIDMVMVPQDWKAFIANTIKQVEQGEIPMARIDDAVTRIVRVKLRAGLFGHRPSTNPNAGRLDALYAGDLARDAVRKSLVLLKNENSVLPLARDKKILVVGKGADNLPMQTGGWSMTWQGTDTVNVDFPSGETILAGIAELVGNEHVTYSANAQGVDLSKFDAVIAVVGETPYAEFVGDIGPVGTLRHSSRYPEDLAVLKAVAGKGKPVVTVLLSGRPVYANDLMNLSDGFVAAWLPGTEGKGVTDVLFRDPVGKIGFQFTGKLSFPWPKSSCQARIGGKDDAPLFAMGYGLKSGQASTIGQLPVEEVSASCGATNVYAVFTHENRAAWPLVAAGGEKREALGADLSRVVELPGIRVETAQISRQHDAKKAAWTGPARLEACGASSVLPAYVVNDGALQFDVSVFESPKGRVSVGIGSGEGNGNMIAVDVTEHLRKLVNAGRQTIKLPLSCFAGADLTRVTRPFAIATDRAFTASFADIQIVGGAARDADVLTCPQVTPVPDYLNVANVDSCTPPEPKPVVVVVPVEAKPVEVAPVEAKPVEVAPVEAKPVEVAPVEAKPAEVAPVEAKPAEVAPVEAKPVEVAPVEAKPVEVAPVEAKPVEPAPVEAKPVEPAPVEAKPAEVAPVEAKPVEVAPVEAKPAEVAPVEAKPAEVAPVEAKPVEVAPVEAKPAEVAPVEAKPVEAAPVEAKPAEVASVEAKPAEVAPVEAKPAEVAPVEAKPAEVAPVEAKPVEVAPVAAQPAEVAPVEATPSQAASSAVLPAESPLIEIPLVDNPQGAASTSDSGNSNMKIWLP